MASFKACNYNVVVCENLGGGQLFRELMYARLQCMEGDLCDGHSIIDHLPIHWYLDMQVWLVL